MQYVISDDFLWFRMVEIAIMYKWMKSMLNAAWMRMFPDVPRRSECFQEALN